jgi:MFS family permease
VPRRLARADPALVAIVVEGFFSRLSFGLISFALPLYAYQRFGLSLTEIGLLLSFNLVVAIALKPVMGALADRIGMKPSFTGAIALRSVVSLLFAFATFPWQLFAIRGIHGVSISLRDPAAGVLLADAGGKKAVAQAFAWYQTAKSVAGAVGKASAGILLTLTASNFSLVFLIAFALSALPILVVTRYVRERPPDETATAPLEGEQVADAPAAPAVLPFAGLGFLFSGTAYMLANLFPIFAVEYAGLNEAQTGVIYLLSIAAMLCGPVFGWLSDNVSRRLVLSIRGAANVLSSVVYLVAPNFAGMAAGRAVDDLGKAAFRPAWGALMAHVAGFDRRRRARTMGSLSAGEDAGEVAGPILAGFLWSTWGVPVLLGVRIGLAAVTELYALVVTRSLERPSPAAAGQKPLPSESDELRSRISELEEELRSFRELERSLVESLITAHRAADQVRNEAERDAERIRAAAASELEEVRAEIERLRWLEQDLRSKLRALIEDGLRMIEAPAQTTDGRSADREVLRA